MAAFIDMPDEDEEFERAATSFDLTKAAKQACKDMKQEDMKALHYANEDECIAGMEKTIQRALVVVFCVFIAIALILPLHFACVLYHHWKNADKSPQEGGAPEF